MEDEELFILYNTMTVDVLVMQWAKSWTDLYVDLILLVYSSRCFLRASMGMTHHLRQEVLIGIIDYQDILCHAGF